MPPLPRADVEAAIARIVADGTTRRVEGPTGPALIVPEATYEALLRDAFAWRRLQQIARQHPGTQPPPPDSDMDAAQNMAQRVFGTPPG